MRDGIHMNTHIALHFPATKIKRHRAKRLQKGILLHIPEVSQKGNVGRESREVVVVEVERGEMR